MPDMLVKLYDLPCVVKEENALRQQGIFIKQALPHNMHRIIGYVREAFSEAWASECTVSLSNKPVSCFVALDGDKIIGFACYNATCLSFFGPTGVSEDYRGRGIGKVLLLKCLLAMREIGYAYGIIGWVEEAIPFYKRAVNAIEIPDSFPGVYQRSIGIEKIIEKRATARQDQAEKLGG